MSTLRFQRTINLSSLLRVGRQFRGKPITPSPKLNLRRFRYPRIQLRKQEDDDSSEPQHYTGFQISDDGIPKLDFGNYVARQVLADEDYWEFDALRRRCSAGKGIENCTCIVGVRKEDMNAVMKSIVGILDLYITKIPKRDTNPTKAPMSTKTYGFITNLVVPKSANLRSIATTEALQPQKHCNHYVDLLGKY